MGAWVRGRKKGEQGRRRHRRHPTRGRQPPRRAALTLSLTPLPHVQPEYLNVLGSILYLTSSTFYDGNIPFLDSSSETYNMSAPEVFLTQ